MPSKNVRCQKSALAFEKVHSHQFFNWCAFVFFAGPAGPAGPARCWDLEDLQGAGSWEQRAGSCPQQGRSYRELQVGRLDSGNNTDLGTSVTTSVTIIRPSRQLIIVIKEIQVACLRDVAKSNWGIM